MSATTINIDGCLPGIADVTVFQPVPVGVPMVTGADCVVRFGSSNDTASIHLRQADRQGDALYRSTTGAVDVGFAGGTTTSVVGTSNFTAVDAEVYPDGSIAVVGTASNGTDTDVAVVRFGPDGQPDPTFGIDGIVLQPILASHDEATDAVLQPDGKLLVVGRTTGAGWDTFVMRLNEDGDLDEDFNGTGIRVWPMPGCCGESDDMGRAIGLQSDGSILLGVENYQGAAGYNMVVARMDANGQPDLSFNLTGRRSVPLGWGGRPHGIVQRASGDIVVVGTTTNAGNTDVAIAQLTSSGALDLAFNGTGTRLIDIGSASNDQAQAALVLPDDDVLVVGSTDRDGTMDVAALKVHTDGTLDNGFGQSGIAVLAPGTGTDHGYSAFLDEFDAINIVGSTSNGGNSDLLLARILDDGTLDHSLAADGFVATSAGGDEQAFGGGMAWDGRIVIGGRSHTGTRWAASAGRFRGETFATYAKGTTDWNSGASIFGACLRGVGPDTSPVWLTDAACAPDVDAPWQPVPVEPAQIATADAYSTTSEVRIAFGLHAAPEQRPGVYRAPLVFEVVAP